MPVTLAALQAALPRAARPWLESCIELMPTAGIDTPHEIASFLAQCAEESNEFTRFEENLNYSAKRLTEVWPKRFPTIEAAAPYAHNPEALANFVYDDANRSQKYALGNTSPGDGWRYRALGALQITGLWNQTACANDLGIPVEEFAERAKQPFDGIRIALWVWKTHRLDEVDDDEDQRLDTRRINGGETGLAHRQQLFNHILRYLEAA